MQSKARRESTRETIADIPAFDPSLDTRFRRVTALAHRADQSGNLSRAHGLYREAVAEANALFARAMSEGAVAILIAPMAFTVAAQNLASLHSRAGAIGEARRISIGAAERLIATAESAATPVALRLNCVRHLKHALNFLADLDRDEAGCGAIAAPLAERAKSVAVEVIRIAEILREAGPTPERWTGQPLLASSQRAVASPPRAASRRL